MNILFTEKKHIFYTLAGYDDPYTHTKWDAKLNECRSGFKIKWFI